MFIALEIDDAISALVPAAFVTHGQTSQVVTAAGLLERAQQSPLRAIGCQIVEIRNGHIAPAGRCWIYFPWRHCSGSLFPFPRQLGPRYLEIWFYRFYAVNISRASPSMNTMAFLPSFGCGP